MSDFDVLIVGSGLVGTSLAAALRDAHLAVGLVETQAAAPPPAMQWDQRIYAISPGSAAFLERVGAWGTMDRSRLARVLQMQVFGDDGAAQLTFDAFRSGVPELAWIAESRELSRALRAVLAGGPAVHVVGPVRCDALELGPDRAVLTVEGGERLGAKLVVGADGADSWVRAQAGIDAQERAYRQTAIVANFECERAPRGIAWQWFRADGVLALLPLPGRNVSMVWSAQEDVARDLLAANAQDLSRRVRQASRDVLGELRQTGPAAGFPLRIVRVSRLTAPRLVLVGDAAHNVHPLAGQGVNLGFQDARHLADILLDRGPETDCGARALARRYERSRKEDILAMQLATDGLQRLFSADGTALRWLRNRGLALTNRLVPVKDLLVRHALG